MYTDPQIHSANRKGFGKGNLGEKGMIRVCSHAATRGHVRSAIFGVKAICRAYCCVPILMGGCWGLPSPHHYCCG